MKHIFRTLLVALAAVVIASTAFGQTDKPGSKDFPGVSRMPGYTIDGYRDALFEKLNVRTRVGLVLYAIRNGIVSV